MKMKATPILLASAVLALILCGCTAKDHVSARLDPGGIVFVTCETYNPNRIVVDVSPQSTSSTDYHRAWTVRGSGTFDSARPVSFGETPQGFVATATPRPFVPAKSLIYVAFQHASAKGEVESSVGGVFDGARLRTTQWLNWNGELVDQPC